ncbi:MAG: hypothetical protein ACI85O_002962 [Saprospiraceae bacterium]|jgi:uncharacterized protein YndB with AHSA1/START domain
MDRVKIDLEFIFRASPAMLYQFFTQPANLTRWFCDEVDIEKDVYTFYWEGAPEVAEMIDDIEEERLRFRWQEADDADEYFEYRMFKSPVTGETILEVTDYCDDDEEGEIKQLWESQIQKLRRAIGG